MAVAPLQVETKNIRRGPRCNLVDATVSLRLRNRRYSIAETLKVLLPRCSRKRSKILHAFIILTSRGETSSASSKRLLSIIMSLGYLRSLTIFRVRSLCKPNVKFVRSFIRDTFVPYS